MLLALHCSIYPNALPLPKINAKACWVKNSADSIFEIFFLIFFLQNVKPHFLEYIRAFFFFSGKFEEKKKEKRDQQFVIC